MELARLEEKSTSWAARVGAGNGWFDDGPDSCVLYISASGESVLGTRIYLPQLGADLGKTSPRSSRQATVLDGPARIRSGPGQQHSFLAWCPNGASLTVFPPSQDLWLPASCYGANGWIYEPLENYDAGQDQPAVVSVPPGASGRQATVVDGPARIRSGPGAQHARLAWCADGASLTVFPPAVDNWLPASCYGADGWIYGPLVNYDAGPAQPIVTPIPFPAGEISRPAGGQQTTVISGPARIRSGPGQQHSFLAWCAEGAPLTVFPPAVDDWLPASCYGANGWIFQPLVNYDAGPAQPIVTPIPFPAGESPAGEISRPAGGQQTNVISGPARIRSGPGQQHADLAWCAEGAPLTVFPPAVDGWLPASCYGANGWIYAPLVNYDAAPAQPAVTPIPFPAGDTSRPASEQRANVISGPARIRSGPGLQHADLAWCDTGVSLTVFPPAVDGWLPASCLGTNGWIYAPLVNYDAGPAQPVVTPIPFPAGDTSRPAGGQQTTVISGPARIRSGPGQQHAQLAWCADGAPLTVFPPAVDGWLPASCYGANGWIYQPLVNYDAGPAQAIVTPIPYPVGESSRPASAQQAIVISGPANIRSGPGQAHPHLSWCSEGLSLTVWTPAVDGWLPASCYGANGWIHESLVSISN